MNPVRILFYLYLFLSTFFMLGRVAFAGVNVSVATACHMPANGGEVQGENLDERIPTASVSKVFTSEWAIAKRGLNYRYPTYVDLYKTEETDTWDVHLRGSGDPFFDREQLHFLISELNKMGVTKVKTFSFDEKFKFTWDAKASTDKYGNRKIAIIELPLGAPTADTIETRMNQYKPFLLSYDRTRELANKVGITLVANPQFTVEEVKFVPSGMFCKVNSAQPHKSRILHSAPMKDLLREMNRNSNNYAADLIFASMGGATAYERYARGKFGFNQKDIRITNGSGAPLLTDLDGNTVEKYYNEATCRAVLKVLKSLRDGASKDPNGLAAVMVVAGLDQHSTLKTYNNETTDHSLVGKTGTINPNVALAGMLLAKQGNYLFYENMNTGWSAGWSAGRQKIKDRITGLIQSLGGPSPQDIQVEQFYSYGPEFDETGHSCGFSYVFQPAPVAAKPKS